MENKIEQVKKILYQGYLTDIAAEKINALYSEPQVCPHCDGSGKRYKYTSSTPEGMQSGKCPACNGTGKVPAPSTKQVVCPKPEQMMICPHCNGSGQFHVDVSIRHAYRMADVIPCAYCSGTGKVPVPSTPAKSELLPDMVSHVCQKCGDFFKVHYASKVFLCPKCSTPAKEELRFGGTSLEEIAALEKKYRETKVPLPPDELLTPEEIDNIRITCKYDVASPINQQFRDMTATAKAQLAKCRQYEASRIKELEAQLDHDCLQYSKDLEIQFRADQKKIGEWGNEPCPHRNNDFPFPKAVPSELQMPKRECRDCWQEKSGVAKLQKGDF